MRLGQYGLILFLILFSQSEFMVQGPRKSITQLAQLNATLLAQNKQLDATERVAQQAYRTQNNIQGELYRQRGVIEDNIDKNRDIKSEVGYANKKTNEMRRRNFCIKLILYLVIILLFAVNIGLIIWKASAH